MFIRQYHAFKNNCVQWQSFYLARGDHDGPGGFTVHLIIHGLTLAVKMYMIDGILLLHAIVHRNNLGDTRGRHLTFY